MDRSRRLFVVPVLSALALAIGCAGPRFPAPIEGVPICEDFTLGHTLMVGGLQFPVRMRVLNGKTVVFQTTIPGLRHAKDTIPSTYIADDNASLKVEWSQCSNEHAPRSVAELDRETKAREKGHEQETEGMGYQCGDAKVYATTPLETKKGDRASHVIHFAPPPKPECWTAAPSAAAALDAGAPDAAAAPESAADAGSVASGDAGPVASDAGAAASDAGAAVSADAGAKR